MENENTENKAVEGAQALEQPGEGTATAVAEDPCRQQITVEIPADVVAEEQESIIQKYAKQARVPGFRQGKVPASVVRSRFAEQIKEQMLENLVPQYFRVAVMSGGYKPISSPHISDLHADPGEAIRFTASFDVMPEFELGDYKSIKVEKPNIQVSDEEVEHEIKHLQDQQASFDPVEEERALQNGDFAQVSFEATPKAPEADAGGEQKKAEQPVEPVRMDDVMVEIGGPSTVAEFTENLRGAKGGEERSFEVVYPQEFHDARLAGKTFGYKVKINAIKKKTLPELNDAFAKELSPEIETMEKLRETIKENLRNHRQHEAEHEAKEKLIDQLVSQHEFPVPSSMIEHQIDLRLERGLRALAAQGMRPEDMKRMDFRRLRLGQREGAIKEVKSGMLLHKIADAENIQISDEELEQELLVLAQQTQQTPEDVKQQLSKDQGLDRIRSRMRGEKALNFLYSNLQ
ncbi:MAG TPA: trigger factor [Candidatus Limnocylindrales bacterium]|nr:trigger factor [Candidatus Limnocylindrales bacterium]